MRCAVSVKVALSAVYLYEDSSYKYTADDTTKRTSAVRRDHAQIPYAAPIKVSPGDTLIGWFEDQIFSAGLHLAEMDHSSREVRRQRGICEDGRE